MDFWGFEGRQGMPGDGFGLFNVRFTIRGTNKDIAFGSGATMDGDVSQEGIDKITKRVEEAIKNEELVGEDGFVRVEWEEEVTVAQLEKLKKQGMKTTAGDGTVEMVKEPKKGQKGTVKITVRVKVAEPVAAEEDEAAAVEADRSGDATTGEGGATVQAQAVENPPEETSPPDKTPPAETPPDKAPEAKPEKPGLLFNVNLGWGQASSTQTSLGVGGYGSPYPEAMLSSSSYNFGSIGVSNFGEGLGIGSGPGFIDFSNTGFMIRQQYGDTKRKARELDIMIDRLLAAINQGNFDAIESALTLINLKSKTTALGAAKEMITGMQHYDKQTKDAQDRITGLINNQGMKDIDKNAELSRINSEMGQYSMFRQALQNSMRDVLSMVEQMTDLENSYRQRSERIKSSSTRWA